MKMLIKRLALFSVCFIAVLLFVVREYIVGTLAPRSLGVVLALVCLLGFLVWLPILTRTNSELKSAGVTPGYPADEVARRRYSNRAKIAIVFFVLLLLNALRTLNSAPLLPQLIGIAVNLSFIAALAWYVIWLRWGIQR